MTTYKASLKRTKIQTFICVPTVGGRFLFLSLGSPKKAKFIRSNLKIYVFYHVTYAFRLNLHSVVSWILRNSLLKTGAISEKLSDCNGTRIHNPLIRKQTLSQIDQMVECLFTNQVVVSLSQFHCSHIMSFRNIPARTFSITLIFWRVLRKECRSKEKNRSSWITHE